MDAVIGGSPDPGWSPGAGAVKTGVDAAVEELRRGRPVILTEAGDREIEGDLVLAAEHATSQSVAFLVRHTSGYLGVAAGDERWNHLRVPLMAGGTDRGSPYGVAVDASKGITTGISAQDRASTIRILADPATQPEDLVRPGHVVTVHAGSSEVLEQYGRAEAAVDLMRLAGLQPVVALGQVVRDDGPTADPAELRALALAHDLAMVTIGELIAYRARNFATLTRAVTTPVVTDYGAVTLHGYRDRVDGAEHLAIVFGRPEIEDAPLIAVHQECLTGDAFGSRLCDCGHQLDLAMTQVAAAGAGVVVYLRSHGGAGMVDKLRAFARQEDGGPDTDTADHVSGRLVDAQHHLAVAHILRDLGIERVQLLTSNPRQAEHLADGGVHIDKQIPLVADQRGTNTAAARPKRRMLGHVLAAS